MEENKVAQMTKHTDTSRLIDSGVSGNAQTSAREIREKTDAEIVHEAMGHHAKHYWGLIQWMKRKKMGAGDLARIIAEGHTVAGAMWNFYENNWQVEPRLSEDAARSSEARPRVGTAVESNTADEKECSRLASRVEELENLIAKRSGCPHCTDSASGDIDQNISTEIRRTT